jgi:hypothetical protein
MDELRGGGSLELVQRILFLYFFISFMSIFFIFFFIIKRVQHTDLRLCLMPLFN